MHALHLSVFGVVTAALAAAPAAAAEMSFETEAFARVSVAMGVVAEIDVGPAASVRAEGAEKGLADLEISVESGELKIRRKKRLGFNFDDSHNVTVYVTAPALAGLEVSSGAVASAKGVAATDFVLDVSTGADATVSGTCEALSLDISTGGNLDAEHLRCKSASVDASTGANASITASERVVADAVLGASIDVFGGPKTVDIDRSLGGDVTIKD